MAGVDTKQYLDIFMPWSTMLSLALNSQSHEVPGLQ
jgi:hypothetical protein